MNRLEMYQYLERQRREISDAEDALAEEQARLDLKRRDLVERHRTHNKAVMSQLGYICIKVSEDRRRTRSPKRGLGQVLAVAARIKEFAGQGGDSQGEHRSGL